MARPATVVASALLLVLLLIFSLHVLATVFAPSTPNQARQGGGDPDPAPTTLAAKEVDLETSKMTKRWQR